MKKKISDHTWIKVLDDGRAFTLSNKRDSGLDTILWQAQERNWEYMPATVCGQKIIPSLSSAEASGSENLMKRPTMKTEGINARRGMIMARDLRYAAQHSRKAFVISNGRKSSPKMVMNQNLAGLQYIER